MNKFSRDTLFDKFHKQTGLKPFSSEFFDSLVAVMRDKDACLTEQVFAWSKWRSWGNSSKVAVSDWDPRNAWRLDQTDCALDLAWLQEGRPVEWVEGMPKKYRLRMREKDTPDRPKTVRAKSTISEAFTKNDDRGTITFNGQYIIPAVSPRQKDLQKFGTPRTFEKDPAFLKAWEVSDPVNFEQWRSARATYLQARNVAQGAYQAYRKSRTSAGPIISDVKALPNGSIETPPPPFPPPLVEDGHEEEEPSPTIIEAEPPPATPAPPVTTKNLPEIVDTQVVTEVIPASPCGWETFKSLYPKERLDWKAKKKFTAMPAAERQLVIRQLIRYMDCDRWHDQNGRWIPNASNWLEAYDLDPPALIRLTNAKELKVIEDLQFTLRTYNAMYGGKK